MGIKTLKQQGAALIIALIMLVILTILGVAVMESSLIEEKMASNYIDRNQAFQAAEAALRDAEQRISQLTSAPIANNSFIKTLGQPAGGQLNWWTAVDEAWWLDNNNTETLDFDFEYDDGSNAPRYVVEEYNLVCDTLVDPNEDECILVYRITAMAWTARSATVMLQSLFTRRF